MVFSQTEHNSWALEVKICYFLLMDFLMKKSSKVFNDDMIVQIEESL